MKYIFDTNIFIDCHRRHLPFATSPHFWQWLESLAKARQISIPGEVYAELACGDDELAAWIASLKSVIVGSNDLVFRELPLVLAEGYGALTEEDLERIGADPYVVAYALAIGGKVVTSEIPGRHSAPRNKKIPSVCAVLKIPCLTITAFLWEMRGKLPG